MENKITVIVKFKSESVYIVQTFFHSLMRNYGINDYTITESQIQINTTKDQLDWYSFIKSISVISHVGSFVIHPIVSKKQISSVNMKFPIKNSGKIIDEVVRCCKFNNLGEITTHSDNRVILETTERQPPFLLDHLINDILLKNNGIVVLELKYHDNITIINSDYDLNYLLDKISENGINSLDEKEKEALDNYSLNGSD